ncbi:MAG: site-2 protease family protein [Bacteroidia bacterium]
MEEDYNGTHNFESTVGGFPPKPVMIEQKKNTISRSLISLMVYALLFYFIFEQNIAYIAAILVVIIIHESGHFLFMRIFNYSNVKIFIVPLLGAFTTGKKQEVSQWQLCLIILAGPVPGILIGSAIYYFNMDLHNENLKLLANAFLIINLLNCLPFYPLDGGRLIETLFFKQNHIIRLIFGIISIVCLAFLFFQSPIMLIVPVLIGFELYNESKHQKIRDYLKHEHIDYHVDYKNLPDKDYWLIRDCLIFSFPKKYVGLTPGQYQYTPAEPLLMQHINSVLQIKLIYDLNIFKKILVILLYIAIFFVPLFFISLNL